MSPTLFVIGLIVFAFIAAFGISYALGERLVRRIEGETDDDASPTG